MASSGRGGGSPGKGEAHGNRGGNRGGGKDQPATRGPRNAQQAHGKDPHRGEPAGGPAS